ncbi:hypothetical protein [Caulobacter sp. CCG-8]|uniref:hypothetical protein n=1 Tax=Caulobacter sp. CCG-8 TaxID=3127958 RepID=UPI00307DA3EF
MISLRTGVEAGAALAVILAVPFIDHAGYQRGKNDEIAAQAGRNAKAAAEARAKTDQAAEASAKVGTKVEAAKVEVRTVTQTLIREVPHYVTVTADAQCVVPAGFVRLHDAAATGLLSDPAGAASQPADAPSGLALSTVSATVAENYGGCREDREALKGWQAWWAGVSPAFKR